MIVAQDVVYDYPAARALRGVSFAVPQGSVLALVGPMEQCSPMVHGLTVALAKGIEHDLELLAANERFAQQKRHLEVLYAVAEQAAAGVEGDEAQAVPQVVQRLGRLFPRRSLIVFECDRHTAKILPRAAYPESPPGAPENTPADEDHPACRCVRERQMVMLNGDEVPAGSFPPPRPHAVLALPILIRGNVAGALMVSEPGRETFSTDDVRTYEAAARQLSMQLERWRLRHYLHVEGNVREAILEQMDIGILLFDLVRNRLTWNGILQPLFKQAGEVRGKRGELPLPESAMRYPVHFQRGGTAEILREVQATGAVLHDEATVFCDQPRTFRVITGPVYGPDGRVELIVQSYTDVTPYRALEQMKTELVAMISHELRTPITAVKGYAQLLAGLHPGDETHQLLVAGLLRETGELADMVERVLAVNRLELEQRLSPSSVLMKEVLSEVISRFSGEAAVREVRLLLEGSEASVRGDREALKSIFGNLLHNAIKYSPAGGVVRIRISRHAGKVAIMVADRGPGIPAEYHETIFQRFFRVPSPESVNVPGSGLGLYIVRRQVEQHGGQVRVWSRPTGGTTFTVTLPEEVAQDG
jgi:signal transduction histidine kinase